MAGLPVIVFLGPSMPVAEARRLLDADYRRPVRRGDLEALPPGAVVGLIDGVFDQTLAVSPREVHEALGRGVHIVGGASMGALRAAEVPGVVGVGRVFEWYRDGAITRDDEVALLFDEERGDALTVPMVNVRFAVERLCGPGTVDRTVGERLIAAALELPYQDRRYRTIVRRAGLADRADSADLIGMLEACDLKRQDAQLVLETVEAYREQAPVRRARAETPARGAAPAPDPALPAGDAILIWESGDRVELDELIEFLGFTGALERYGRAAIARFVLEGNPVEPAVVAAAEAQRVLTDAARRWGWMSPEEARVTLADLGLALADLGERCHEETVATRTVQALIAGGSAVFRQALRAELFLDDAALKREVMRLGALRYLAGLDAGAELAGAELTEARQVICRANQALELAVVRGRWAALGLGDHGAQDRFIELVARARRAGKRLATAMRGAAPTPVAAGAAVLRSSPKPPGEPRFSLPLAQAIGHAERLREVIGITRVGMIGELSELGGVQIAQAARPANSWSSSYGSGKSSTRDGAIVGSIMEETEKWAQEQFAPPDDQLVVGSHAELAGHHPVVDPSTLDLPYDSVYRPDLRMAWYPCVDLLSGEPLWVPLDVLRMPRGKHDIAYTRRGARKHLATNGLGSGFSREEALLHATCEYVERHALRLAELFLANPGGLGPPPYQLVDLTGASPRITRLIDQLGRDGATVRVLDVTSEIAIPTFLATITRDLKRADGHAAHPDPETAIEMALLEAAQTISCVAAGGREDLSIHARSLGRHERPRPISLADAWFWLDPDPVYRPVADLAGFRSDDLRDDLVWCLDRIRAAGVAQVIALDLTVPTIAPAHVVRVLLPGVESNNPFFTGPRARLVLLRDLLPRWR